MFEMTGDMAIGLLEDETFRIVREKLAPGECLVLYSDGVSEAMNEADECLSIEQVAAALEQGPRDSCRAVAESILATVTAYQGTARQSDDITIVTVRYLGAGG
jgi:sigma-B regulation protein RsbU (phosphoserine phosphatase)